MKRYPVVLLMTAFFFFAQQISAQSNDPKLVIDNAKLKVTEYNAGPGEDVCGKGQHSHAPHLTIILTSATVQVTTVDGKKINQQVPSGTTFWSEAETHAVVNTGKEKIRFQIVEAK